MGSLNSLALAGAVAMVATSAALSTVAHAADLMPPPMVAPPPPPVGGYVGGGLYLRGDIGVGAVGYNDLDIRVNGADPASVAGVSSFQTHKSTSNANFFAGVGVGYQFNNFLRFDVTGEMRGGSITGRDSIAYNFGTPTRQTNSYRGNLTSYVGLLNGYFDLGTWNCLTPFVGAGIGFASNRISDLGDNGIQDFYAGAGGAYSGSGASYGFSDGGSKTSFAWALMAGVAYDVNPNLKLELGYRYLNLGDGPTLAMHGASGALTNPSSSVSFKKIDSHDVKIGMRWMFNDPNCCGPTAMAAPLVRKY